MIEARTVIWFEEQWFDLENVWYDLDLIWNFMIWFEIILNHKKIFHAIVSERRPFFVLK